jgi:hypothetical protein
MQSTYAGGIAAQLIRLPKDRAIGLFLRTVNSGLMASVEFESIRRSLARAGANCPAKAKQKGLGFPKAFRVSGNVELTVRSVT